MYSTKEERSCQTPVIKQLSQIENEHTITNHPVIYGGDDNRNDVAVNHGSDENKNDVTVNHGINGNKNHIQINGFGEEDLEPVPGCEDVICTHKETLAHTSESITSSTLSSPSSERIASISADTSDCSQTAKLLSEENTDVSLCAELQFAPDSLPTSSMREGIHQPSSLQAFAQSATDINNEAEIGPQLYDDEDQGSEGTWVSCHSNYSRQSEGEESDSYDSDEDFPPVIPLPELVEVMAGELAEDSKHDKRASLYMLDRNNKQLIELGAGQMKVLKCEKSDRVRLLMRTEHDLKVCCNHYLWKSMQFNTHSDLNMAYSWSAPDYAECERKQEFFVVSFSTSEEANNFKKIIDGCQTSMNSNEQDPVTAAGRVED